MKTMKCNQCGKELEPEVTWHYEMLQVLWYCEEHRCGWVKDIYFTRSDYPSPFADANTHIPTLEGCPTDEEIQLMQDAADQEQEECDAWYEVHGAGKDWEAHEADQEQEEYVPLVEFVSGWAEGRGYGNFPKEGL